MYHSSKKEKVFWQLLFYAQETIQNTFLGFPGFDQLEPNQSGRSASAGPVRKQRKQLSLNQAGLSFLTNTRISYSHRTHGALTEARAH